MAHPETSLALAANAGGRCILPLICGLFLCIGLPGALTAANITAAPGDNLQTKINSLNAGDTLTLAGGNYSVNFLSVTKTGTSASWITIQAASGQTPVLTNPGGQNMFNIDNSHYVKFSGLEIRNSGSTTGDAFKFTGTNNDITIENCYIHNIGEVGINCSSIGGNFQRLTVRKCTITATGQASGATGEGMYLGKQDGSAAVLNSLFENNWVHHTGGSQGDGIELNQNGHGNIFRDNVVHNTNYPCIFIENSNSGANNIVERNAVWNSANETLQVNGYCIVRNNIIQNGGTYALHLSGTGIEVYNNVIYDTGAAVYFGGNLTLKFANNIVDGTTGNTPNGTVTNNYWKSTAYGTNNLATAPSYNAASMNFYPTNAAYINAGWNGDSDVPTDDFNTTARTGLPDVGCYEITGASNPGWTVTAGMKQIMPATSNQAPVIDSGATASPNPVVSASSSTVSVTAHDPDSGPSALTFTWAKVSGPGTVTFAPNGTNAASVSTATFSASGTYSLQVTVSDGSATVTSTLSGLSVTLPAAGTAPSITTQPSNATVTVGQTATFSVSATGTATLSYQWQKNGVNIAGATATSYTTPATSLSDNGATFRVIVTNGYGSVTSNNATLTVNGTAPVVTTQPANKTVTVGQTATFSVSATGTATLTYQWQKNGVNIAGATSSSYTTPATSLSDSGATFRVIVTNSYGSATSNNAILTVNGIAPSITTQPAGATVTAGQTATFSVGASGTATLTYQWQKNGVNIAGATNSSYTTPATSLSDNGATFRAIVTNGWGSATSNSATLTVNAGPNPVSASVGSLNLSAPPGSSTPVSTTFTLTNSSGTSVTVTLTDGQSWLTESTGSIAIPAGGTVTITVTADPTGLSGTVAGSLTLTTSPGGQTQTIPVSLSLTGAAAGASAGKKSGCSIATGGVDPVRLQANLVAWATLLCAGLGLVLFGRMRTRRAA